MAQVSATGSDLAARHSNIQQEQDPLAERLLHLAPGQDGDNDSSVDELRLGGLKHQMQKLWITLNPAGPTQGVVLSAVAYIFLTWAVVPDVGTGATYYFYTGSKSNGGLQFGDVTYSMLSVVGDIAMLGASYIYGAYLGATPLRKLFIGLQLLNVAASALDLALALHWNEQLGISAAAFAGLGERNRSFQTFSKVAQAAILTRFRTRVLLMLLSCQICNCINLSVRLFPSRVHRFCSVLSCLAAQESSSVYSGCKGLPAWCAHPKSTSGLVQSDAKTAWRLTGVEASLTACIAGMNDLSGSVAQYFGAWLTTLCGVTSVDFERVWVIYLVRTACKLIPIPLVLLVPSVSLTCASLSTHIAAAPVFI